MSGRIDNWFANRVHDVLGHHVVAGSHLILDSEVSDGAVRLWLVLRVLARTRPGLAASLRDVAKLMGRDEKTVRGYRDELRGCLLVRTRQTRDGLMWVLLPPNEAQMSRVFDFHVAAFPVLEVEPQIAGSGVSAQAAGGALQPGVGERSGTGGGSAPARQRRLNKEEGIGKTVTETPLRSADRRVPRIPLPLLAEALAIRFEGLAWEITNPGVASDRHVRIVLGSDLLCLLEAGCSRDQLEALWEGYLDVVRSPHLTSKARVEAADHSGGVPGTELEELQEDEFQAHYGLYEHLHGRARGRRLWFDFVDWFLAGGSLPASTPQPSLAAQHLDIKRAARRVRARENRRPASVAARSVTIPTSDIARLDSGLLAAILVWLALEAASDESTLWRQRLALGHERSPTLALALLIWLRRADDGAPEEPLRETLTMAWLLLECGWVAAHEDQPVRVEADVDCRCRVRIVHHQATHELGERCDWACRACGGPLSLQCEVPAFERRDNDTLMIVTSDGVLCLLCAGDVFTERLSAILGNQEWPPVAIAGPHP